MGKYFGTDGFRGEAGVTLTAFLAYKTGRYLGYYFMNGAEYKSTKAGNGHGDASLSYPAAESFFTGNPEEPGCNEGTVCANHENGRYGASGADSGVFTVPETAPRQVKASYSPFPDTMSVGAYGRPRIVMARDTRHSGVMLEHALSAGLTASGADVYLMHVSTTPSVSYITRTGGFSCGIMISASHNPYYDNGIKIIAGDGSKFAEDELKLIEEYLDSPGDTLPFAKGAGIGICHDYADGVENYKNYLLEAAEGFILKGMKIALDLANGSACTAAAYVFNALGASTYVMGDKPDGFNINEGVGSTHLEGLKDFVLKNKCVAGFAYDGDADRCLAVTENGEPVNGDQLMYLCALYLKETGKLKENTLAVTVMSNLGFLKALKNAGISYEVTAVGDRFLWERMEEMGLSLGGEQSGHIIFSDYANTGDGILTSLIVLKALQHFSSTGLSKVIKECPMYPQVLLNERVADKNKVMESEKLKQAIKKAEARLDGNGRILVRPSGTEPLIRVMAEAQNEALCGELCKTIIGVIRVIT